ncbi:MAG TPA: hypothetical protein VKG80_09470 [Trebonia sp.]|nr:hypothetical protein [Trebonia sp.]
MFQAEVRFYREIAPVVGVRVPACWQAEETDDRTLLMQKDLLAFGRSKQPVAVAAHLVGQLSIRT